MTVENPTAAMPKADRAALRVVAAYAALAGLWIALSDRAVGVLFASDAAMQAAAQSVKGSLFVVVTAAMLFLLVRHDLRRRERLLKSVRGSEAVYRTLIDDQSDPMLVVTPALAIAYRNPAAAREFGDGDGRLADLFQPETVDQLGREMAALTAARPVVRIDLPLPGGSRWYQWTVRAVFDDDGRLTHFHCNALDITERHHLEEAGRVTRDCLEAAIAARTGELEETNRRLQDFAEVSSDWLWEVDVRGNLTYLSQSFPFAGPEGVAPLLGRSILDVPPLRMSDGSEEDNERLTAFVTGQQAFRDLERQVDCGPEGIRHFAIKAKPLFSAEGRLQGWRGTGVDITKGKHAEIALRVVQDELERRVQDRTAALKEQVGERRRAEAELAQDRALLRCLIDAIPDLIFVKDPEGVYLMGNRAFTAFVGIEEEVLVGRTDYDFFDRELADFFRENDRRALVAATALSNEEWVIHADGRRILLDTTKTPFFGPDGALLGMVGVSRDITERKRAEAKLVQASKLVTLGEMAAGMAHELNQPLHIIRMAADGRIMDLDDGVADPAELRRALELISSQSGRMAEIIGHTRIFSRDDGEASEGFDAWDAVDAAVGLLRQQCELEGIAIRWSRPGQPAPVRGNRVQLEQVILNLLSNGRDAIRTAPPGDHAISLAGSVDGGGLSLVVADSGPGVPAGLLDRIFEPFFTTKGPGEGTGLGLSISMHLIDRMKGTIEAERPERGARFVIRLPLASQAASAVPSPARRPSPADLVRLAHLLVVDDETVAAEELARLLRREGYRVTVAHDGEAALAAFAADPADLVVTDLRMPRCDGATLIARLHERVTDLPVILLSGQHDADRRVAVGRRRGEAARILRKPIDFSVLSAAAEELLGGR